MDCAPACLSAFVRPSWSNAEHMVRGRQRQADRRILDRVKSDGGAVGVGLAVHHVVQRLDEPAMRLAQRRQALGNAVTSADRSAGEQREPVEFIRVRQVAFARGRGETPGKQRNAHELLTQPLVNLLAESQLLLVSRFVERPLEALLLRDVLCNAKDAVNLCSRPRANASCNDP